MQDPSEGFNPDDQMTKEGLKDGPSYTPRCLWRRTEKMEFA